MHLKYPSTFSLIIHVTPMQPSTYLPKFADAKYNLLKVHIVFGAIIELDT